MVENDDMDLSPARRAALMGVLTALALVAGYLEVLVPLPVSVPGVKLGHGNADCKYALVRHGPRPPGMHRLAKLQ